MSQMIPYDEVLRTARSLDESERARLVEDLLGSLSIVVAAPLEDAWLAEFDRRSDELDAGKADTISWQDVRQRAFERAKLNG